MNNPHGLPARPNFSATPQAGPSQPRPPTQAHGQNQRRGRPHQNQQQQQHYQGKANPSLSYNSYANQASYAGGYPQYGLPQPPSYGMMGSSGGYQQPNISGGYPSFLPSQPTYPQYPQYSQLSNQLSAQALFHQPPQPQVNSGGYSYSSTYAQSQPPAKRQRPNSNSQASSAIQSSGVGPGSGSASGSGKGSVGTWRNCSHPGCKFVGPSEKVQIHEEDRHLIFVNGKMPQRSEEEERYARRKGPPPPIQGTNITLNTPEEIEKWIAERKAKWPSAKRIQEKEEERTAAIARGEIPARGKRKKMDAASLAEEWGRPVNVDDQSGGERTRRGRGRGIDIDRGSRGRGRGRGRGGHIGHTITETGDQAWSQITTLPSIKPKSSQSSAKPSINALSALEGYDTPTSSSKSIDSSSDAESDSDSSSGSGSTTSSDSSSENDSSEDESISKDEDQAASNQDQAAGNTPISTKGKKEICKFFKRNGNCKFGNKCRNLHMIDEDTTSIDVRGNSHSRQPQIQSTNSKKQNHFARPSMLGSLLSNPIQNTISQLSQTIRFLVANNMLEGVELNPGDAQAQEDEKNKITEIEETT
ncbi:hypothetical protein L486_05429 [Kwoniella mangroviensis CBS 10435]|uniref:C3H1-type domain-containing protein n=1 Tax=Kwoniella mangroviensis CBS 10435 TaxID=1331196 RepID=A0A1B9ILU1_9TREE|nr:hypothetical protein L486_05429 [Kwoniella mangroviensis CBS 10435]